MKQRSVPTGDEGNAAGRLRNKLILAFLAATVVPLGAILWMGTVLLRQSLDYAATEDLDRLSKSLETIAREYYRQAREHLKAEALAGKLEAQVFTESTAPSWPQFVAQFRDSGQEERFFSPGPGAIG